MTEMVAIIWLIAWLREWSLCLLRTPQREAATVTQLLSAPTTANGQKDAEIVVSLHSIMPGATLPVQKHPYARYGYILSGNLRVTNMETGHVGTYKPGDFVTESVGQWHMGANIATEPVKLLVIDIVDKGQTNTILQIS
jgi:quercetin dioxygenase-like cupin family protein